jgi:hypothetical protein
VAFFIAWLFFADCFATVFAAVAAADLLLAPGLPVPVLAAGAGTDLDVAALFADSFAFCTVMIITSLILALRF